MKRIPRPVLRALEALAQSYAFIICPSYAT